MSYPSRATGDKRTKEKIWPEQNAENSPWVRWWWPGSAVNKKTITNLLQTYHKAGIGGVELTSTYGVKGQEKHNIQYMSPRWLNMFKHTLNEARKLGMKVDTPLGSGWRTGGRFITDRFAGAKLFIEKSDKGYTLTIRPSGDNVKRAGSGGKGKAFNPFSRDSFQKVIDFYTPFLKDIGIRAQFHDSWEYASNTSYELFDFFCKARGYDIRKHIDQLAGNCNEEIYARVKYDYQITLAEMILKNFIIPWVRWSHKLGHLTRNQAHGSPGNLLDIYGAVDIPETEVFREVTTDTPLLSKFASSSANVTGKTLVSSETGTWLKEHFNVSLSDLRLLVDNLFVSGINHIIYQGTAYSPPEVKWPGWLFYASTQINPQNTIWRDFPTLNRYVARCQSVLQKGRSDNDLLVYFPIHDVLHNGKRELGEMLTIDGYWLKELQAIDTYRYLWKKGYGFDYISDNHIAKLKVLNKTIVSEGGNRYKTLLIPPCRFLPVETLENLIGLSKQGGKVLFISPAPSNVPGLFQFEKRQKHLNKLMKGVRVYGNTESALSSAKIQRESLMDIPNLMFIRRKCREKYYYFIANQGTKTVDEWITLTVPCRSAMIMDPMSGTTGFSQTDRSDTCKIRIQIHPGASLILRTSDSDDKYTKGWRYTERDRRYKIQGIWEVEFIEGGPTLPKSYKTDRLSSWTERGEVEERFAGTALYRIRFDRPVYGNNWEIDLGEVYSSARIRLNGKETETLIGPTFKTILKDVKAKDNLLEVEVTNLAANRIRYMDRQKIRWRIFEDINFVNIRYKPFDARGWKILPSGLIGPVRLISIK